MAQRRHDTPPPMLRDLYPTLSETELAEVEANLDRYLALAIRIFEHSNSGADISSETFDSDVSAAVS